MSSNSDDQKDARFAALLGAAGRDGPAPDREFLARLREESLSAFLAARAPSSSESGSGGGGVPGSASAERQTRAEVGESLSDASIALAKPLPHQISQNSAELSPTPASSESSVAVPTTNAESTPAVQVTRLPAPRRASENRSMFTLGIRLLVTCVVGLIGLWAAFLKPLTPSPPGVRPQNDVVVRNRQPAGPPLVTIVDNTAAQRSLQFLVREADGDTSTVLAYDDMLRVQNGDDVQIIRDNSAWHINEPANEARRVLFREANGRAPLVEFLQIPENVDLNVIQPQAVDNGVLQYDFAAPSPEGDVRFKVVADSRSQVLTRLERVEDLKLGAKKFAKDNVPNDDRPRAGKAAKPGKTVVEVVAVNGDVDEKAFVVKDTLTEDGRIGKVVEVQGLVSLRPANQDRWSPVCRRLPLKPNDWLRTDVRGANAVSLRLVKSTDVIVGPATQVELLKPAEIRLHSGELEITADEKAPIELLGAGNERQKITGTQFWRRRNDQLVRIDDPEELPKWLAGFKGTTAHESIGTLLARTVDKVDARNEPLTMGYHKVTVDIRDQIARTTIEESFVNNTRSRMEGVFHFPLPADASISGFGMWIGDTLIEADVVEKQRAREIYETILREKRDPGLLEWAGGNIFKARVFPIEPESEKRIKLVYTQVLPMRGGKYRYSYALQSEMLRQNPLRELQVNVQLSSAVPLKSVQCPTHTVRTQSGKNSARVEFSAQEYVPTRDFEVVVETEKAAGELVLIPHRRGDDGYLLLQITPDAAGGFERDILGDSGPLHLLVIADTSASMDVSARRAQSEFVSAILASLTPKDTVNLATSDVETDWAFETARPASPDNLAAVRKQLDQRVSLGWTDLDKAFASAFQQARKGTQIVYVGDGISTTGNADPVEAANRIKSLYTQGTAHAVVVGSSYEAPVVNAIASLGGGSVRRVSGDQTPQAVALDLMGEITRPGLHDLAVEFKGIRTAAVHPGRLSNLAKGSQQILLGRYLPQGSDQSGEVIVTGKQGDQPVRYAARVSFKDAEAGNEFIPRLWAKMEIDHLLEQGAGEVVKDQVIALSEEFHVMTPYTSLLVLESDADRERFKVKRRFQMRDGEQFFQEGRDNSKYELARLQMLRARDWRLNLRRHVLRGLATLGRDPHVLGQQNDYARAERFKDSFDVSGEFGGLGAPGGASGFETYFGRPARDGEETRLTEWNEPLGELMPAAKTAPFAAEPANLASASETPLADEAPSDGPDQPSLADKELGQKEEKGAEDWDVEGGELDFKKKRGGLYAGMREEMSVVNGPFPGKPISGAGGLGWGYRPALLGLEPSRAPYAESGRYDRRNRGWYGSRWWETLFPTLPATVPPADVPPPKGWSDEALALSKSLLRRDSLKALQGGIVIERQSDNYGTRSDLQNRSRARELVGPASWLVHTWNDGSTSGIQWCDAAERGIINGPFQFGRLRKPAEHERTSPPLGVQDYSLSALHESWAGYTVRVEKPEANRAVLIFRQPNDTTYEYRHVIDTERKVLVHYETRTNGQVTSFTEYGEFVDVGGRLWATRIETRTAKDLRTSLVTQKVTAIDAPALEAEFQKELAGRERVQFLPVDLPTVTEARRKIAAGQGTFVEHLVILIRYTLTQQWTLVFQHLDQCEKLAADKPGLAWIRLHVLQDARRHNDWKTWAVMLADRLAALPDDPQQAGDRLYLAQHLVSHAASTIQANEVLQLLDAVKSIYDGQPAHVKSQRSWRELRVQYLDSAGRSDEALDLARQLAQENPSEAHVQQQFAQRLANSGDYPAAYEWIRRTLASGIAWNTSEKDSLHQTYAGFLEIEGRFAELVDYAKAWAKDSPDNQQAYSIWLAALVRADRIKDAEDLMRQWIREGSAAGEAGSAARARLDAAVYLATGQGHNLYRQRIDEEWQKILAETAIATMLDDQRGHVAERIVNHWRFNSSDAAQTVFAKAVAVLKERAGTLPTRTIRRLIEWIADYGNLKPEDWKPIAAALQARWSDTADEDEKYELGAAHVRLVRARGTEADWLALLRLQHEKGPEKYRDYFTATLLDALEGQPWTQALEDEMFSLLPKIASTQKDPPTKVLTQAAALYKLVEDLQTRRIEAAKRAIANPENLTKIQLREKHQTAVKETRKAVSERLAAEQKKSPGPLSDWMAMERRHIDIRREENLPQIAHELMEILPKEPPVIKEDKPEPQHKAEIPARILEGRAFAMLAYLATRPKAEAAVVERVEKFIDAGVAREGPEETFWKGRKFDWLVARDRPKDLQAALRQWMQADDPDARWRISLGYLLAELGSLPEAVAQFEAASQEELLGPLEYRTLAAWYMALDRRQDHDAIQIRSYQATDDWRIQNYLGQWINRAQQQTVPVPLDDQILLMFKAALAKTDTPSQFAYLLDQYYRHFRDFRLMEATCDAVIGHSALGVYPFVQQLQSTVFSELREEATVDRILAYMAKVRERARTNVDQRALDLLEALVERRASEVQNQAGPHAERALAALKRAFNREWEPGESVLVANLLASMGGMPEGPLAVEQRRELDSLHRRAPEGTREQADISLAYANVLSYYGQAEKGTSLLRAALDAYAQKHGGVLGTGVQTHVDQLVRHYEVLKHFMDAEKYLQLLLAQKSAPQHRLWVLRRLYRSYAEALTMDGAVSLGSGQTLFDKAHRQLLKDLDHPDQNHRWELVQHLMSLYVIGHQKKLKGVGESLRAFALDQVPAILTKQTNNYQNVVQQVSSTIETVMGPRDALEFLITQIEREPQWLRWNNQDGWTQFGYRLAQFANALEFKLGDLDERLLKIVVRELRNDLEHFAYNSRQLYHASQGLFWESKRDAFARVAEEVYARRKTSQQSVLWIADYFYHGLSLHGRAIEILLIADREKRLDLQGQYRLATYLQERQRFGESIALLQRMIEAAPDWLEYRTMLMRAYFRTNQPNVLRELLAATDKHFHEGTRWSENVAYSLAEITLEIQYFDRSVEYYREAITRHEATAPGRGVGDDVLWQYYRSQARAYAGLGKTAEAVDAAVSAIHVWPRRQHNNREEILNVLLEVLRNSKDLPAFIAQIDAVAAKTGTDRPVVRKMLGKLYSEQMKFADAARQLKLAVELEPNDREALSLLTAAYVAQNRPQDAIDATLEAIKLQPRNLQLYQSLGEWYAALKQPKQVERAYTSLVEVQPNESESHTALATIRQGQNRWPEAVAHWQRVAEIRKLEPEGLLGLTEARIHLKERDAARDTLRKLRTTEWPERFRNQVEEKVRNLEKQLEDTK